MTDPIAETAFLSNLGWSEFFKDQLTDADKGLTPMRIATVHRARLVALSFAGPLKLVLPLHATTGDYAVGDWVLVDPLTNALSRRLQRKTVLARHIVGKGTPQLAGANIDTLFIVTSCNDDFNPARLERYLALANQAGTMPVILLTKADMAAEVKVFIDAAKSLQRDLNVVVVNPRDSGSVENLSAWCGVGQTVALIGSSGVGKSTLVNRLAGPDQSEPQVTGDIRAHDSKGRHTTTSRSLHAIQGGGWVIDTPGIRTLHLSDVAEGLETLFAEITELAPLCKFRDCTHAHEPGCAVRQAVAEGRLDAERLVRWRKLGDENRDNQSAASGTRGGKTPSSRSGKR